MLVDKKNIVIALMAIIILILVSALFIGGVNSPDRSKSVIEQQKPKDLNVAGVQTDLSNTPDC